jgi:hypothetical protein
MMFLRIFAAGLVVMAGVAAPAGAQEADEERNVEITFDTGDFDSEQEDWPITIVYVTGDLDPGEPFTVELTGEGGAVLWSATEVFTAPTTTFTVVPFVPVGAVTGAGVSQAIAEVAGDVVERRPPEVLSQGAGGGGGGTLALSMVLAVVLVAIVFRTPLPSATSQRWTK